jgi:hypothetical protein
MSMKTLSETLPFRPRVSLDLLDELVARSQPRSSLRFGQTHRTSLIDDVAQPNATYRHAEEFAPHDGS